MTIYAIRQIEMYLAEGNIQENILQNLPVPLNILEAKVVDVCIALDDFQSILMQNSLVFKQDSSKARFQQKVHHVICPNLVTEGLKHIRRPDPKEPTSVLIDEHIKLVKQTVPIWDEQPI